MEINCTNSKRDGENQKRHDHQYLSRNSSLSDHQAESGPRTMKREATPCEDRTHLTVKAGKGMIKEKEQAHSVAPATTVTEVNNPRTLFVNPSGQSHQLGKFLAI